MANNLAVLTFENLIDNVKKTERTIISYYTSRQPSNILCRLDYRPETPFM